jgi:xylan 1,4-beta-xylosidase
VGRFLGVRNSQLFYQHLGCETYLAPVTWDKEGWPVINGNGHVSYIVKGSFLPSKPVKQILVKDDFDAQKLGLQWNFIRNPLPKDLSLTKKAGWLSLRCSPNLIKDTAALAFVGRSQQ